MTMNKNQTPTAELPQHIPVFSSEDDIPGAARAWRRHSYRVWGDGSGRILWSPSTDQPLAKTRWAPSGAKYPPSRYTVVLLTGTCAEDCPDPGVCPHRIVRSGPIVVDRKAEPKGHVLTVDEFQTADRKWRTQDKNLRAKAARAEAREQTGLGPSALIKFIQQDISSRGLPALARLESRLRRPSDDLVILRTVLNGILDSGNTVLAKLSR
jgi:hypothetical protein